MQTTYTPPAAASATYATAALTVVLANKLYDLEQRLAAMENNHVQGEDVNTEWALQDLER